MIDPIFAARIASLRQELVLEADDGPKKLQLSAV
jgi:hypothetical protein